MSELRSIYPILKLKREDDGQIDGAENYTDRIPRVCFASVLSNINGQRVNKGYTALALLEMNNLTTLEEAEAERMAEERGKQLELEAKEKEAKEQESKN